LAGYFSSEATTSLGGFENAGSNLLGLFMPRRSGWLGERLWVDPTSLQYDGFSYVGTGVLLGMIALAVWWKELRAIILRHKALAAIGVLVWLFALSNHIYVGSHLLVSYAFPRSLEWIADQFRGPGRFSWLPVYLVVIVVLTQVLRHATSGWKRFAPLLLALIQVYDVTPDWRAYRELTRGPQLTQLDRATWHRLATHSERVHIFPAHACNSDASFELATQIQYLISNRALPINGVYSARSDRDCVADAQSLIDLRPEPRALYVFVSPLTAVAKRLAASGFPCARFAYGHVCHSDAALIASLKWEPTPLPDVLRVGQIIDLTRTNDTYLEGGWLWSTSEGRWTEGPVARMSFRLDPPVPSASVLAIEASAFLCNKRTEQLVDVSIGDTNVGTFRFDASSNDPAQPRRLAVPAHFLTSPIVELELRPRDSRSPYEIGCRRKQRDRLGIAVRRIWLAD
jgi:hypothetical protein